MPQTEEWIERHLAGHLAPFRKGTSSGIDLAGLVDEKISLAIRRLNALPESDPFWVNTNREPTVYKVYDYFSELLKMQPDDEEARWILFAYDVWGASSDLGYKYLEPLILRDFRLIRWLVASARWGYYSFGGIALGYLREALESLEGKIAALNVRLEELQTDTDQSVRQTAAWALEVLGGGNPFRS